MAEVSMLLHVAEGIVGKLFSYGIQELVLWWGVQGELDKLKYTVSSIQAVLLDAGSQEQLNHQDKNWVEKLKSVVYEADNLLDDFDAEVRQRQEVSGNSITKEVRLFFSCSNQVAYGISMGHKIKALRERLDTFVVNREKFSLKVPNVGNGSVVKGKRRRDTESSTPEIVVGRVEDKKKVIELLMGPYEEDVWVLPIQGLGGLGKTTLAQMVFNDEEVESYFSVRLWVCVSDLFDVEVVVRKMLESATGKKVEDLQLNTLKEKLRKMVGEKKCLLVLDDVWNEDENEWGRLKNLISGNVGRGSRIIVTTRLLRVAEITRTLESYVLKELSVDESWSFLVELLFRGQEPKSTRVTEIGKRIVEKCLGVPLVIKAIASILREKNPETKWLPFLENELSAVGQSESVELTLKLSYDHLPLHLKHCFAYCALFPKDHKIRVQTLIHLWISHGFIQSSNPHLSLEDIGYRCFLDLLWRSFFQDVEKDVLGNVIICKMHDLMHDLATSIAKPESTVINPPKSTIINPNVDSIDEKTRHVSFHYDLESPIQIPSYLPITNSLQTLLLPSQSSCHSLRGWEESKSKYFFSSLKRLRALDLHNLGLETVPSSIGNLKHLRYLDVSENEKMEVLPSSITKLQNLQILNLEGCRWLEELPVDIGKLSSLSHLLCEGCYSLTHMPRGIGQLTCLQSLTWFIVAKDSLILEKAGGLSELNKLNELRRIEIRNLGYREHTHISEFEAANLKGKEHLESLVLRWNRGDANGSVNATFDEMSLTNLRPHTNLKQIKVYLYGGLRFPDWFSSLMNLIEIQIVNCHKCQYIPRLDQLPFLKELHIEDLLKLEFVDSEGNYIHGSETFFPSLEKLSIQNCLNLKGWWKEIGASGSDDDNPAELPEFTSLSLLNIGNCPQLSRLPLFTSVNQELNFVNANLQPLQQHRKMIPECPSVYIFVLSHVVEIKIKRIDGYQYLPSFHQIPSLKYLHLESFNDLEYISSKRDLHPFQKGGDRTFFPSLKRICIQSCSSLKRWWKDDDNNQDATVTMALELPQFPCLSQFEVRWCPNFTWVPGLSSLDQNLYLSDASMVTMQLPQFQYPKVGFLSWLPSLTKVVEIEVSECTCRCIPPLDQLPSLQVLTFQSLPYVEYIKFDVSTSSAFFPSLKKLSIQDCPSLEGWQKTRNCDDAEGDTLSTSLPEFHCLSSLIISKCRMLISLPMSQTLAEQLVFEASNLKSFPSNLSSLTNLREIRLVSLIDLKYVDQGETDQIGGRSGSSFFPFLKELEIRKCPVLKGWWKKGSYVNNLPQFPRLSVLSIWDCPSLTTIPRFPNLGEELLFDRCSVRLLPSRLSSFANLREVTLSHMDDLEYIENEAGESTTLLPSLKRLWILNCPKLRGWWKMNSNTSDDSTIGIQSALPHFPSLSYLEVMDCPRFTLMPLFPTLEELSITRVSSEIFQQTVKMKPVSGVSIFPPLSSLKKLYISDVADLEYMNCPLCPSLKRLSICNCPILEGWWGKREEDAYDDASHFPLLSSLEIVECPMLTSMHLFPNLDDELRLKNASIEPLRQTMEMKIKMKGKQKLKTKLKALAASNSLCCSSSSSSSSSLALHSRSSQAHPLRKLKRLQIERVEDFRTLPETWLQNLSSLKQLTIKDCPNITSVPQGLESWPKNLTSLTIKDCPNLTSMPQGLHSRTSLQVEISGCPQLSRA